MRLQCKLFNNAATPEGHAHAAVMITERAAGPDIALVSEEALPIDEASAAAHTAMVHMRECLFALGFQRPPGAAPEES